MPIKLAPPTSELDAVLGAVLPPLVAEVQRRYGQHGASEGRHDHARSYGPRRCDAGDDALLLGFGENLAPRFTHGSL